MTTVSGSFTATGSSASLQVQFKETATYAITGTFVGTWKIEQDVGGGQAWKQLATGTGTASGGLNLTNVETRIRVTCSAYTSGTLSYSISDSNAVNEAFVAPDGTVVAESTDDGFNLITTLINGTAMTAGAAELNVLDAAPVAFTVTHAASATTDGIDVTVTAVDAAGSTVAGVYLFEFWVSEAATGIGLTADTASGDLTFSVGSEHEELTSKKHYRVLTATTGIATCTLVDSANPTDQYFVVANPFKAGQVIVSAASGTNWEGV